MDLLRRPHPGDLLRQKFLGATSLSQNQLAQAIGVPGNRIHAIVNGTRDIRANTALRLGKFFDLQKAISCACRTPTISGKAKRQISSQLAKIKPYNSGKAA
jgi:addiction module HigA family antidote